MPAAPNRKSTPDAPPPAPRAAPGETPLLAPALALAGAAAFAVSVRWVYGFTADDAFITYRHAANWVAGHGPSFEAGERVEGVTSFLGLVAATLPLLVGADVEAVSKGLGIALVVAAAALAAVLAASLAGPDRRSARLAAGFTFGATLAFPPSAVHAVSGMETALATFLLTAALARHARAAGGGRPTGTGTCALWLLVGLCRPELNAVAAGMVLAEGVRRADPAARRAWWRAALLGYAVPGAVYFAARAGYYGHLLPLPFYAKVAGGDALPGRTELLVLAQRLAGMVGLPLAAALGLPNARRIAAFAGAAALLAILPDPVMNFDHRYAMPALPALFAVSGAGLAALVARVGGPSPGIAARWHGGALVVAASLAFTATAVDVAFRAFPDRHAYGESLKRTLLRFGDVLADYREEAGRTPLIAMGDVGAVGFRSGWRVLDTHGLNEPRVALAGRLDAGYVLGRGPDLVAVVSEDSRTFRAHSASRHDQGLFDACTREGMKPAVILAFSARSFTFVMARPETDVSRYLQHVYLGRPR